MRANSGILVSFATLLTIATCPALAQGLAESIKAYDAISPETAKLPYGVQSISGAATSSDIDLDSILRILAQGGDVGDILADEFAEFDINLKTNRYGTWKLRGGIDTDAEVEPRLAAALDAAQLSTLKAQLNSQIETLDAYSIAIVLSPESKEDVGRQSLTLQTAFTGGLVSQHLLLSLQDKKSFDALMSKSIDISHNRRKLGAMLENRSKLAFSAKKTFRSGIVGPDKTEISVSYSRPLGNGAESVRRIMESNQNCAGISSWRTYSEFDLNCASTLAALPRMFDEADKQQKLSFSLTYSDMDAFAYADMPSMFSQSYESTRALSISAAYGRNYTPNLPNVTGGRLDASFSFEDVKNDVELNDRGILQATYTLNFESFALPITLTWSNKSELVGDADAKLGGHIGIQYRLRK